MTTVPFVPTTLAPFQFQATLDGAPYNVVVTWNVYRGGAGGSGYYISVYDQSGTRILTLAMVGSPPDSDISLTAGYFSSTLVFREDSQTFEALP